MDNDVDDFLADLERYSAPSLLSELNARSTSSLGAAGGTGGGGGGSRPTLLSEQESNRLERDERRKRKKEKREREEARVEETGTTATASSSNNLGPWSCPVCTCDNEGAVTSCVACGYGRNGAATGWICARCSVMNDDMTSRRCVGCRRKKSVLVLNLPPPPQQSASSSAAVNPIDGQEEVAPVASPQLFDDEDEEDEEDEDDTDDDEVDDQLYDQRGLADEAVREFFSGLDSVDFANLPEAVPPPTMAQHGSLKNFQLQSLGWLMSRESGTSVLAPTPAASPVFEGDQRSFRSVHPSSTLSMGASLHNVRASSRSREVDMEEGVASHTCGGILADYMGLGKTRTLVALCESTKLQRVDHLYRSKVKSSSTLIVCPVSLIAQWVREINTCVAPTPRILRYYGKNRGRSLFEVAQQYDYVITSYQTLAHEFIEGDETRCKLNMIYWFRVILDEAHYIRNPSAKQSKGVLNLVAERRWAVTGTPVQNCLNDLFPLLKFLNVPHFSNRSWWNSEIANPIAVSEGKDKRAVGALQMLLSSLLLRRLPTSKINGEPILLLPPKTVIMRYVKLTDEEQDFYGAVHKNAMVKLDAIVRRNTQLSTYATAFEMLMRCRQACLHPYLVVSAIKRKMERQGLNASDRDASATAPEGANGVLVQREVQQFLTKIKKRLDSSAGGGFAEEVTKQLESQTLSETECIICLDNLQQPAILPCGHMFCGPCIEHCLSSAAKRCPICKRPTKRNEISVVPQELTTKKEDEVSPVGGEGPQFSEISTDEGEWMESSRVTVLLEEIQRIPADEKIVVFSYFLSFLKFVQSVLLRREMNCVLFSGELSAKNKDKLLQSFSKDSESSPRILLATITTCGVGINLTCATRCFIMDPSWNPGVEEQAMNRMHRIGQTRPVIITKFLSKDTVEERIEDLAESKRGISDMCLGGSGGAGRRRMGKEEIMSMFSPIGTQQVREDEEEE